MENSAADSPYAPPAAHVADVSTEEPADNLNPWFSMWTQPRATIRHIVATNPTRSVAWIAMAMGVAQVLERASTQSRGDRTSLAMILGASVVSGPIVGLISLYGFAWLLSWCGKLLGGHASRVNLRAAIAWSNVPALWVSLLWVPQLAAFGSELFTSETPRIDASTMLTVLFFSSALIQVVGAIWTLVALCKCLGEVQEFSAWKGLGNIALAVAAIVAAILGLVLVIGAFAR